MGLLVKIKLVEMVGKAKPNAVQQRRAKLVEQLQEQLTLAGAMLAVQFGLRYGAVHLQL